ncbi:hypothetical protein Caci_5518 [Catenulispora acidiphila DSM 44928]|uniref:Uncharacterized protein n=1 Tax=Catenulispora acidiphila (strain DSM 44928 / JCM 14897 / NBRC 102108 / NRRL B-24433 / ID139908) TaxID=479433 RepID=C7QAQ4_CATAD|nr:hypothetical protein [Catenulispora acidiphila]ACU74377.1 hypothetical protein Caci_5518 [Catenulispora acidiphila DSM 44928]
MPYSPGWDGAGDATNGAHAPAGSEGPAALDGTRRPDGHAGSGDNGGGTTVSSVDFLADLGPSADTRAVARVLAAATAPPWPHELRGYEAARRAFENAGATPVRRSAAVPLRRLIGVKLAAVAGALTVTGVAVAAEADVLPSPIQRAAHQMLGGVGVPEPDPESRAGQTMASSSQPSQVPGASSRPSTGQLGAPHGSQSPDQASADPSSSDGLLPGTPAGTADSSAPSTSASDAAEALTLCREYATHKKGNGNGGLSEHDRRKLVALAGGADKIDAYCAQVLAAAPTPTVPQPTGAASTSQPAPSTSAPPSPSHDHKPAASTSSSSAGAAFGPAVSSSSAAHAHVPDPTRRGR